MKVVLASREGEAFFHLLDELPAQVPGLEIVRTSGRDEMLAALPEAEVLFGFVNDEVCAAAPKLRWVQSPSAGVEHIPGIAALRERDIVVTNSRGAHGPSIGEHTFALLLALTRQLPLCFDRQRERSWQREDIYFSRAREIRGMTMGIIGYGAIGREVVRIARALGMRVLVFDPYVKGIEQTGFDELLRESDFVVPLAVATAQTENLMNAAAFAKMKRGAYFINASRGNLVDEASLEAALDSGHLAGCALDVGRAPDQMPTPGLAARPDVLATPHAAGLTLPAIEHQSLETVAQAAEIAKGRAPKGAVNAEHWTRKP
jgi:D-3-phosphoglycerate dehydrogenase